MNELESMLRCVMETNEDGPRRVLADWIEEHCPVSPVNVANLPLGFNRFWSKSGLGQRFREQRYNMGKWSNWEIMMRIQRWAECNWLDHGGASEIAGLPVLVGEPYQDEERILPVCRSLQELFQRPVTFARRAAWNTGCIRVIVWFTVECTTA